MSPHIFVEFPPQRLWAYAFFLPQLFGPVLSDFFEYFSKFSRHSRRRDAHTSASLHNRRDRCICKNPTSELLDVKREDMKSVRAPPHEFGIFLAATSTPVERLRRNREHRIMNVDTSFDGREGGNKRPRISLKRFNVSLIPRNVSQLEFRLGERVHVRPKSRHAASNCCGCFDGIVDSPDDNDDDDHEMPRKAWIKMDDGARQQAPCHRLFPVMERPATKDDGVVLLVVTHDTSSFRQAAWSQLQPWKHKHHVVEFGCSTGQTSEILWRQAASWVGFDTSASMIKKVQERQKKVNQDSTRASSQLFCMRLDALVDPPRAREMARRFHEPTDAFLDIGGNRSEEAVWRLLHFLCSASAFPELGQVVIKSEELHDRLLGDINLDPNDGPWHISQLSFEKSEAWLQERVDALSDSLVKDSIQKLPKHPLKAPMRSSPLDGTTPICRFHNYHANGCARFRDKECPYDHTHCHWCLQPGHVAKNCPKTENWSSAETP
eukprot:scaffold3276_cov168-Amphora_coffeaeformis.AAC.15